MSQDTNKPSGDQKPGTTTEVKKPELAKTPDNTNKPELQTTKIA